MEGELMPALAAPAHPGSSGRLFYLRLSRRIYIGGHAVRTGAAYLPPP